MQSSTLKNACISRIRPDAQIRPADVSYENFIKLAQKKRIFILSVNLEGIGLSRRFRSLNLDVGAFLDTRFSGKVRQGLPVIDPDLYFQSADPEKDILFVCTKDREWKIKYLRRAIHAGFKRHHSLFTPLDVCRFFRLLKSKENAIYVAKHVIWDYPGLIKVEGI